MAQTDARPGFRLPWSSDRQSSDPTDSEATAESTAAAPTETAIEPADDTPAMTTAPSDGPEIADPSPAAVAVAPTGTEPTTPEPARPGRKPTRFMADLTKAMAAAAEDARVRAVSQLQADAKTHIETIHGRSSTEAAALRRAADDDVAAVREWSKAEIARIREETETRITDRKGRLETEIEGHAGTIEREIDAVQKMVAAYEAEMAAFFERLLGEEDPSRFATMAENLPEAPSFEAIVVAPAEAAAPADDATQTVATGREAAPMAAVETDADQAGTESAEAAVTGTAETAAMDDIATGEPSGLIDEAAAADSTAAAAEAASVTDDGAADPVSESVEAGDHAHSFEGEIDRESAFAAIQAAAEAAASAEVAAHAAARAEAVADVAIEIMGNQESDEEIDPRFAALGLSPDYDAAEAEALIAAGTSDEEIPELGDDAIAARLAGLVTGKGKAAAGDVAATQIVVVGLVSVASIASFKRHLGRLAGVQSVGVSSGPDGEFVFAVNHSPDVSLREAIPSLPSFQARVTGASDGVVHVTAHDPEADA